ncbi:MAG: DUF1376 domain-containing protein, partial [Candidatus Aenigmatarchaeota archaeon]
MNKPPAFQFYPKDFTSDINVKSMELEEVGAYILLLCHVWEEEGLPNDLRKIKACLNNSPKAQKIFENIKHCFYIKNEKIFNRRLDQERRKQKEWRKKSRLGGLKSAETRRLKSIKGGLTKEQPPLEGSLASGTNQSPTLQSSSSSSSSSAIKEKKEIHKEKIAEVLKYFNKKTGKNFRTDP